MVCVLNHLASFDLKGLFVLKKRLRTTELMQNKAIKTNVARQISKYTFRKKIEM